MNINQKRFVNIVIKATKDYEKALLSERIKRGISFAKERKQQAIEDSGQ